MTDYQEEQSNELEALESIYPDELSVISSDPFPCFQVSVNADGKDADVHIEVSCAIQVTYTETYPDTVPEIEITDAEEMDEEMAASLLEFLKEQAEENVGMVIVFTLVSAAQEKLAEMCTEMAKQRVIEAEKKKYMEEEEERKKFEGTRCSIETFMAWKAKFDAEMAEIKRQQGQEQKKCTKPTGRELFMNDDTMDDSDIKFLEEDGADTLEVDESLFQEMDDLDLDDEEFDVES